MIELIIFHLHILAALFGFTKNWQTRGIKEGLLAIAIIGLMFSIGWSITGTLAYLIMPYKWNTTYFTRDTLSLILLLIPEIYFFYHFIYKDRSTKEEATN